MQKCWMMVGCVGLSMTVAATALAQQRGIETRWLAQLDAADRTPLQRLVSHAPPLFADELTWHNIETQLSWQELQDKIVVIQSFTTANDAGREAVTGALGAVNDFSDIDVQLILLHTPEGAEEAAKKIEDAGIKAAVIVDPRGEFCDSLGVYRTPVNLIVDRHGAVRYAGLTFDGVKSAINVLIDEIYDSARCPEQRNPGENANFPTFTQSVGNARDRRGQPAPALHVEQWINEEPDTNGKLTVLAFWATWCGPCIASIPRLNQVAENFADDVTVIGVSSEEGNRIAPGLARRNLSIDTFKYSVGYDSSGRMANTLSVRGIPHSIVMCSDWIVRWQGHPGQLRDDVIRQLIEANKSERQHVAGRWMASR